MDRAICSCAVSFTVILFLRHSLHSLACQASRGPTEARMFGQIPHFICVTKRDVTVVVAVLFF